MTATASFLSIAAFLGALWMLGIVGIGLRALGTAHGALAIMRDNSLDDRARESAAQSASLQLFAAFANIAFRSAIALMVSFLPIWLADTWGLASAEAIFVFLSRWDVIGLATIATTAGFFAWRRMCRFK